MRIFLSLYLKNYPVNRRWFYCQCFECCVSKSHKKKKPLPCDVLKAERAFIFSHMCTLIHTHAQSHTTTDKSAHTARAHSWWCHEINTMCCADENGAACLNAFPLHKVQFHNILSRGNSSHEGRSEALVQHLNKKELILL